MGTATREELLEAEVALDREELVEAFRETDGPAELLGSRGNAGYGGVGGEDVDGGVGTGEGCSGFAVAILWG